MKTKEKLTALKEEVEAVNRKLHELTDEELAQVTGGGVPVTPTPGGVQPVKQPVITQPGDLEKEQFEKAREH